MKFEPQYQATINCAYIFYNPGSRYISQNICFPLGYPLGTPTLRIDSIATHGDVSGQYYVPVLEDGDCRD